ncbi:hypothetical protein BDF22DRAFT_701870 [Syncephalis plumigaleata]|nr:hypothetical protein BDF22DRAFT_701870 [Syncephalis plumigaleata]
MTNSTPGYGELNVIDYLDANDGSLVDLRDRYHGVCVQLLMVIVMFYIFVCNCIQSVKMVMKRPGQVAPWSCTVVALSGVIYMGAVSKAAPVCLTIAIMGTNTLLLERAYLAHQRSRLVLTLGVVIILISPVFIAVSLMTLIPNFSHSAGCYIQYPSYYPYVRLAVDIPANIVFSISFIIVIYRQYKRYGDQCWKKLAREGVITMMLVIISSIICAIGNAVEVLGSASDILFIIDWVLISTLLVGSTYRIEILRENSNSDSANHQRNKRQNTPKRYQRYSGVCQPTGFSSHTNLCSKTM